MQICWSKCLAHKQYFILKWNGIETLITDYVISINTVENFNWFCQKIMKSLLTPFSNVISRRNINKLVNDDDYYFLSRYVYKHSWLFVYVWVQRTVLQRSMGLTFRIICFHLSVWKQWNKHLWQCKQELCILFQLHICYIFQHFVLNICHMFKEYTEKLQMKI